MRAAIYTAAGGPETIEIQEVPTPEPGPAQVRVRVQAAGLNRADILQRLGHYPAPPGWPKSIPGLEYAGVVDALGPGVARRRMGERVMGLVGGGAHAEYVVVHEDETITVPRSLDSTEAAAIPESFLTAYDALVTRGRLQVGERLLWHAVTGGVGTAAIQVGKYLGAVVLGTSRTAAKLERCRELGLDVGIDTSRGSFRDAVGDPVNVIVDSLGGPALADNLAVLAPRGRLVLLGFLQGSKAPALDLAPVLQKRLEIIGTVMRSRSLGERITLCRAFADDVLPLFAAGKLYPVIGSVFPMLELRRAHQAMEQNTGFGKIVLVW